MSAIWHIYSAVILRRTPVVLPEINIIEKKVQSLFENYENAHSNLSDHEIRHQRDKELAQRMASEENPSSEDIEAAARQTAQDFEDASKLERSQFEFGPYKTKDENNRKSFNRCLDKDLILVLNQKFGSDTKNQWLLPQAQNRDDELLIDTARRALTESIGLDAMLQCRFLGTVPASVYAFNYPKKIASQINVKGAKVFFLKAFTDQEKVVGQLDYEWLSREECSKKVHSSYWSRVQQCLLCEQRVDPSEVLKTIVRARTRN